MAYSDWGAFVYQDGVRREDREDVAVFDDQDKAYPSGARIFMNLSRNLKRFGREGTATPWYEHSHHAVLGDGAVRLCGYKQGPELWRATDEGAERIDMSPYALHVDQDGNPLAWSGTLDGYTFTATPVEEEHLRLMLLLFEPDGSRWSGHCGYLYGAGHMEVDPKGAPT